MTTTRKVIFYSWQSDLPNKTNRGFIQEALENAAKAVRNDDSIEIEPVLERDTQGIPGSPDIAQTIFGKIDQAHVFVCDISNINWEDAGPNTQVRATPNPNVLIELGYAQRALGKDRILLVLNTTFGTIERLPFDLRTRRTITYSMPEESERATERKRLEKELERQLRLIFSMVDAEEASQPLPLAKQAQQAIEASRPDQASNIRLYMTELAKDIDALTPKFLEGQEQSRDDLLIQAIAGTSELVLEFAQLADTIAQWDAHEAAHAMYKGFSSILDLYQAPRGFTGAVHHGDFDLPKFVGHELFVMFISCLMHENRWQLIADLLDEDLYVRNVHMGEPGNMGFGYVSQYLLLLDQRKHSLHLHSEPHAHLLKERHVNEPLAQLAPLDQFVEADYFLFLRVQPYPTRLGRRHEWTPWSAPVMQNLPPFLADAERVKTAQQLLSPLGLEDIAAFRDRFVERLRRLGELSKQGEELWGGPLTRFDPSTIGSR